MPVRCRLIDYAPGAVKEQPGDMWFMHFENPAIEQYYLNHQLSDQYKRDWHGKRPPICVCLPNGYSMCVDSRYSGSPGDGWTVTGEAPHITVHPSINYASGKPHGWHGWLQNGFLSNDVDGRK